MIKLRNLLNELVTNKEIICDKCDWHWNIIDGGKDIYICHKCGHDNKPVNEAEEGHKNDRDMVVGVAEIIRMIRDMKNREEVLHSMIEKFNKENVIYNRGEFTKMCGL